MPADAKPHKRMSSSSSSSSCPCMPCTDNVWSGEKETNLHNFSPLFPPPPPHISATGTVDTPQIKALLYRKFHHMSKSVFTAKQKRSQLPDKKNKKKDLHCTTSVLPELTVLHILPTTSTVRAAHQKEKQHNSCHKKRGGLRES